MSPAKQKVEPSAEAKAWYAWRDSTDGRTCRNATTLGAAEKQSKYLENRLWRAFFAGVEAATKEAGDAGT